MLNNLKNIVFNANQMLPKHGLVTLTWGNVSGIDREKGLIVIKPSGVDYNTMSPEDMVIVDMDGKKVDGRLNPSSDTPTHCELYKRFISIGGIVHTHSTFATAFAQSGKSIKAYGTTHADYFFGDIPVTRDMTDEEINAEYEKMTGVLIVDTIEKEAIDPMDIPAILVKNHGPFVWGLDPLKAVENSIVLEEIAKMNSITEALNPNNRSIKSILLKKHFLRKHGKNAYYGQKK